jgi:hypothetical protein
MNYNFEWDPQKAQVNFKRHGILFGEAATVFNDPNALTIFDSDHSGSEDRWITMGISKKGRLLLACHTFKDESKDSVSIRLFSSRKATRKESTLYGE